MNDDNRQTFTSLQQRGVLEIERIRREEFTGERTGGASANWLTRWSHWAAGKALTRWEWT